MQPIHEGDCKKMWLPGGWITEHHLEHCPLPMPKILTRSLILFSLILHIQVILHILSSLCSKSSQSMTTSHNLQGYNPGLRHCCHSPGWLEQPPNSGILVSTVTRLRLSFLEQQEGSHHSSKPPVPSYLHVKPRGVCDDLGPRTQVVLTALTSSPATFSLTLWAQATMGPWPSKSSLRNFAFAVLSSWNPFVQVSA